MVVNPDVLARLVPGGFAADPRFIDGRLDLFVRRRTEVFGASRSLPPAQRLLAYCSAFVLAELRNAYFAYPEFGELVDTSGFIGVGIFSAGPNDERRPDGAFPIIEGYRFGIVSFRSRVGRPRMTSLPVNGYDVPVVSVAARFTSQSALASEGYVAATFDDGDRYGITAAHVVEDLKKGDAAPILCPGCGTNPTFDRAAAGLLDAAVVKFSCGCGARNSFDGERHDTGPALEGATVELHLGDSGLVKTTVMMSLSSKAHILSAAMPEHFLTKDFGVRGDSGSLVSGELDTVANERDLTGIYLGKTDCEDASGHAVTYGYGLDLEQAAKILETNSLKGEPND